MTQEDKELLLKDLCARLSYGVKFACNKNVYTATGLDLIVTDEGDWEYAVTAKGIIPIEIGFIKPYLFPLSSITEGQRNDISKLLIETQNEFSPYGKLNMKGCDNLFICTVKQANVFINYCLTYHLDINGLIEKGLAIDATGKNIY